MGIWGREDGYWEWSHDRWEISISDSNQDQSSPLLMQAATYFTFGWEDWDCLDWTLFLLHLLFAQAIAFSAEGGRTDTVFLHVLCFSFPVLPSPLWKAKQKTLKSPSSSVLVFFSFLCCRTRSSPDPSSTVLTKINRGCFWHQRKKSLRRLEGRLKTKRNLCRRAGKKVWIINAHNHWHPMYIQNHPKTMS